ncbi:MAG: aminoglycoside N(3)-acetyltransferase, partial [Armatimonadetes bacterium]|nr:aminoglycoside N(3)-acetyltransferase [Armatimonadota bacterium]
MASVTTAEIVEGLRRLGVERGMKLMVHSSLRSFGHVDGGAEAVIAAL